MDGFALARALRAEGPWCDLPLVALTGRAGAEDVERGREAGFTDYVAKFDRAALLDSLAQCLAASSAAPAGS
jgi:two-component system, chemotaxis family, sensor kinase CheA